MDKMIGIVPVKSVTKVNPYLLPGGEMLEIKMTVKGHATVETASPSCVFCGRLSTFELHGRSACENCRKQIKNLKEDKKCTKNSRKG